MNEAIEIAVTAVRLYAETHPRPSSVTQKQAAEMIGISAPTLARIVKTGRLKLNAAGRIPIGQVDALIAGEAA
jgi:predicted DNA-binding protein (UPF0251 family)